MELAQILNLIDIKEIEEHVDVPNDNLNEKDVCEDEKSVDDKKYVNSNIKSPESGQEYYILESYT
ncbi:MAG: hypothetical protein OHK0022_19910 [Roseiflexaceae bacterium]